MPGIRILTVIAFLILYSEEMQRVNVRSRNSATSWEFWLYRCEKQGRGHQNADAVVDPDLLLSNTSHFLPQTCCYPTLVCSVWVVGSHKRDIFLRVFDVPGLWVLSDSLRR